MNLLPKKLIFFNKKKLYISSFSILIPLTLSLGYSISSWSNPLPSLGSDSTVTTLQEEFQIGRKVYSNIKSSQTFLDYPLLEDFIMHKLSKLLLSDKFSEEQRYSNFQSFNRVKIFFIDDEKLNAFALPGNFIGLNKGLITKVKDHRELFAVLCHEIAHLTQRHISRRYSARKDSNNLMLMTALLSALIIGSGGTDSALGALSLGQTMAMKKELEFSRHAENEADKKGMEYLLDLQIHPKYMTQMLDRIQQQSFLTGRNETSSWLRTHPLTVERLSDLSGRVANKNFKSSIVENNETEEVFDLLIGFFATEKNLYLKENISTDIAKKHYSFWQALNTDRNIDAERIIDEVVQEVNLREIKSTGVKNKILKISKINYLLKLKQLEKASSQVSFLEKDDIPNWMRRTLLRLKLSILFLKNEQTDFKTLSRQSSLLYPNDDWFLKKRAFMAFKNGNKMEAHYYFARAYIVNGMDRYAIEQLSTALEFYNNNKILRAKVNAELQRLKKKQ